MQFLHALAVFKKLIATGVFSSSSILLHQGKETETGKEEERYRDSDIEREGKRAYIMWHWQKRGKK